MSLSATGARLRLLVAAFQLHTRPICTSGALLQHAAPSVSSAGSTSSQARFPPRRPRFPPRAPSSHSPHNSHSRPPRPTAHSSPSAASQPSSTRLSAVGDSIESDSSHLSPWEILKAAPIPVPAQQPSPTSDPSSPATAASSSAPAATPRYTFTPPSPARPEVYVSTPQQLHALTAVLSDSPVVAIDTEFLTFPTHRPALHVFQVASLSVIAVIDYQLLSERAVFLPFLRAAAEPRAGGAAQRPGRHGDTV